MEFADGGASRYMYRVLTRLKAEIRHSGKLPHYVAVCITKFDDTRVFESALRLDIVEFDPVRPELPRVPDEEARDFFQRLIRLSRGEAAKLLLPMLSTTFREERIKFFVTSATGFYVDSSLEIFDPNDYQNHIPGQVADGPDRIRGGVYPINVMEPMVWLGRNMTKATR